MPFICYVYREPTAVPYMEILWCEAVEEAEDRARRLLADRPDHQFARLFDGEVCLAEVLPDGAAIATSDLGAASNL